MICHSACLRKSGRGRPGLLLQVCGPRVQRAPGRCERLGVGGGGSGAARLGVGGLGQLKKAVSRVTGGGEVAAARQDRVMGLEFNTAGARKSRKPIREGVQRAGDAGRTGTNLSETLDMRQGGNTDMFYAGNHCF